MPGDGISDSFWRGRRVLVTGHTGFIGGWLCLWLARLGAHVTGFALTPPTQPNLFELTGLGDDLDSRIGDIRDPEAIGAAVRASDPEIVFHLAAQPLVLAAHDDPVTTFETNVMGTVHLLQALRGAPHLGATLIFTSDKVYENREWSWGYREADRLGGHEPYASSKACADIAVETYRRSYFRPEAGGPGIATIRAGNVIGGGDWAADRLIPDAVRAFSNDRALDIRNPQAVRPWQHVLDLNRGVLMLAERLYGAPGEWSEGWNFGPAGDDARPVAWIADRLVSEWGSGAHWRQDGGEYAPETNLLLLDSGKAETRLGWRARWPLEDAVTRTVTWYRDQLGGAGRKDRALADIAAHYESHG